MYRIIREKFKEWKQSSDRKPLIIIGARQVGKTYSCREFGRENYKHILEINFQDDVNARNFFSVSHSAEDIIMYLEINNASLSLDSDSLIFFDEIQLVPELITALKFLKEKCSCDIICSGSMLGITINRISSFPVGYVEIMKMYPMSFKEFVIANGIPEKYTEFIKNAVNNFEEIPDAVHERFNALFTQYLVCGGMPEAVSQFVSNGLVNAINVNRRLMRDFEMDIVHYADSRTRLRALDCFQSLPVQLAKDNKKFQYKLIKEGYNARHFDESLTWLKNAGLVYPVHRLKIISEPLEINKETGVFKEYLFDTGLLASQFTDSIISNILTDTLGVYKGVIYENVSAQLLKYLGINCYYYEPNTSSEIDFVIEFNGGITPIEVKGGIHTRSTSFANFVRNHKCADAFRFSKKNVGISDDGVTKYLPVYSMEWAFENNQKI